MRSFLSTFAPILLLLFSCAEKSQQGKMLFELMDSDDTGVSFRNDLSYNENFNPYTFRNFYNGAGVALGDINNDGLIDIFLAGNQTENKLYLNKGNFQFEDITEKAGLAVPGIWSTGVSMADVNGDGLLDIYICKSGPLGGEERYNSLYINNGDLTFTESAKAYGIADEGLSQHAVFFDFDKDGDLDMYLLNNSARSVGVNDLRIGQRDVRDPMGGNKLYRNDGGFFTDVSEEAGIYGSAIGYGLGVTVADLNKDGWPDLYVSNDFFEKDYLYINNGDGTFTEALEEMMTEISMGSMGADIADLDNDGWLDIFITEMLPNRLERVKTKTPFEEWDKYQANVKAGYFHQFTRNTLQRNLGFKPNSDQVHFAEISRMAGVHATDWSWGALIFDMDNDGYRDIFVANGIVKDLTDFDYVDYYVHNQSQIAQNKKDSTLLISMIDNFPSVPQRNFLFKNNGGFDFTELAAQVGMDQETFSTGAAYADLDNDGDLDLIVNNLNGEVFIFKNNSESLYTNHFVQLDLGRHFGAQVTIRSGEKMWYAEHNPVKGYMSSVDPRMHFGLGEISAIDALEVIWPNGSVTQIDNPALDTIHVLCPNEITEEYDFSREEFSTFLEEVQVDFPWQHQESDFIDFDRDRLRFHMISNEGPNPAVADINGDGLDDVFFPGAKGQASVILKQKRNGAFEVSQTFEENKLSEDVAGVFFDANGNGLMDLYVVSGGLEFGIGNANYQNRLYLNDGKGSFAQSENGLPRDLESSAFTLPWDYDQDGNIDLLVGVRNLPFAYGLPGDLKLFRNKGDATFERVNVPEFEKMGMLTDAVLADVDGDGQDELVVVGEWMPIKIYKISGGSFEDISTDLGFENTSGLWNSVSVLDWDGDGRMDLFFGNSGTNTRLQASESEPLRMYVNDFDQNGSVEQILTVYENGEEFPFVLKSSLLKQLPGLRKQLLTYDAYKDKKMEDLFSQDILDNSLVLEAKTLSSALYKNKGNGTFTRENLPTEVQYAPIYASLGVLAKNNEKHLILGGNQSRIKPELGIQMGSYGWLLQQNSSGEIIVVPAERSGLYVEGEIRNIQKVKTDQGVLLMVSRNNNFPKWYMFRD
ncbi:VCBS repeat-containing protein [Mongoliibacter ruber]|uniref:VCBS repeat protein n=1 Tax=Mongoliibacter ruber TaxID=1750599 RepID=A0A2T0WQN4_9BACT|nr:VCBS repeat-containing protein [Mongoliibacter ruber]PRY89006.1 VCBS repeat protein [Mongoliibacter ruber]